MAQWVHELNFKDLWEAHDKESISLPIMAKEVAKRIENAPFYKKYENYLEMIVEDFKEAKEVEDFDYALEQLYDWADMPLDDKCNGKKMCWIRTF